MKLISFSCEFLNLSFSQQQAHCMAGELLLHLHNLLAALFQLEIQRAKGVALPLPPIPLCRAKAPLA